MHATHTRADEVRFCIVRSKLACCFPPLSTHITQMDCQKALPAATSSLGISHRAEAFGFHLVRRRVTPPSDPLPPTQALACMEDVQTRVLTNTGTRDSMLHSVKFLVTSWITIDMGNAPKGNLVHNRSQAQSIGIASPVGWTKKDASSGAGAKFVCIGHMPIFSRVSTGRGGRAEEGGLTLLGIGGVPTISGPRTGVHEL